MKKKKRELTGIMLLCLFISGIQSCSKTNESIDLLSPKLNTFQTDSAPTVTTSPLTSVTSNSAISGGHIVNKGNSYRITSSGVCWSTTSNPTLANHVLTNTGQDLITFSCTLTELPAFYYVRAYATNSGGFTGYGNEVISSLSYITSAPIVLSGQSNRTLQGLYIANIPGIGISLSNCHDITIAGCKISHTGGNAIYLNNCYNITITHCEMDSVQSGLYAIYCTGGIVFNYNDTKNIQGPFPQAQMVQFKSCTGANNSVSYNTCDNVPGYSHVEDVINMFMTSGTADSPILINGNRIRGGGPSTSGGGIIMGDGGGGYQSASNNILVDPGQYGIAIAGGNNSMIQNNLVYARSQFFTNVGIYLWNQNATLCENNTIQNNRVNYTNKNGQFNDFFNGSNVQDSIFPLPTGTVWNNNVHDQTLNSSILPTVLFGSNR